jgi:hypothetical protein
MAKTDVTAPCAAFNTISQNTCNSGAAGTAKLAQLFSMMLTALAVATAQQRRFEAMPNDRLLQRHADAAWRILMRMAQAVIDDPITSSEDQACRAFALVIHKLADMRGTRAGQAFHQELMADPTDLLGLFRHAQSARSDRLFAAAFSAIDRLSTLHLFRTLPPGAAAMMAAA